MKLYETPILFVFCVENDVLTTNGSREGDGLIPDGGWDFFSEGGVE